MLHECGLNTIPTIGVIDTDANPTWVTYPIPANDDSLRCVQVIAGTLGRAGQEGQARRIGMAKKREVTYTPDKLTTSLSASTNGARYVNLELYPPYFMVDWVICHLSGAESSFIVQNCLPTEVKHRVSAATGCFCSLRPVSYLRLLSKKSDADFRIRTGGSAENIKGSDS